MPSVEYPPRLTAFEGETIPDGLRGASMTQKIVLLTLLFSPLLASAKEALPSLREVALQESKAIGIKQASATDAQVSGMLSLKDPRPEILTRRFKYMVGFYAQNFQAQGEVDTDLEQSFNLAKNSSTFMPGIEIGLLSAEMMTGPVFWSLGLKGRGSYSSQATGAQLSSGFQVDDARLNTTMLSLGPLVKAGWGRLPWLSFALMPQWGTVNFTQTSANDFAQFSKHSRYEALNYGLHLQVNPTWTLFAEWSERHLVDHSEKLALQKNNFELGAQLAW